MQPVKLDVLKNGSTVTLRNSTMEDLDRSMRFFEQLTDEDRQYLRFDMTNRNVVKRLIRECEAGNAVRIEALVDDKIVAHGVLELVAESWKRHMAEIRVIVSEECKRQNLGTIMIGYLFREAKSRGVEKLVARMAAPQVAARKILERLGFEHTGTVEDHIKDAKGQVHSMIIMTCSLDAVANALREYCKEDNRWDG